MGGGVVPDPPHAAVAATSPAIRSVEVSRNVASDWNLRMGTTLLFAPHEVKTNRGQTTQFTSYDEAFTALRVVPLIPRQRTMSADEMVAFRGLIARSLASTFPSMLCFDGDGNSRFQ
jgi:hypothetical protein